MDFFNHSVELPLWCRRAFPCVFKTSDARNLGLRWPRFYNRGPALDSLNPVDEFGRPLHVVRKNRDVFAKAQWELAMMNFSVCLMQSHTRRLIRWIRFPVLVENLPNEWNKKAKVTVERLQKLAFPFPDKFVLIEGQKPLTPEIAGGRARCLFPRLMPGGELSSLEGSAINLPILLRKEHEGTVISRRCRHCTSGSALFR